MNKHGFPGIRKKLDGRAKPFYGRIVVLSERIETAGHATAAEAARTLRRMAVRRTTNFPPCTCGKCHLPPSARFEAASPQPAQPVR